MASLQAENGLDFDCYLFSPRLIFEMTQAARDASRPIMPVMRSGHAYMIAFYGHKLAAKLKAKDVLLSRRSEGVMGFGLLQYQKEPKNWQSGLGGQHNS